MLRPVHLDPALIGQALPWDVFTQSGVMVAAAGMRVADEVHFNRLAARPLYREGDAGGESPLPRLAALGKALQEGMARPSAAGIRRLAVDLLALARADDDACLGYAHLVPLARPSLAHVLRVALVARLLAEKLEFSEAEQESLAAAALSMNLAALDAHDRHATHAGLLDEAERAALRDHPAAAARQLESLGVRDPLWLDAVRQHHENLDGSGYPAGVSGAALSLGARVLRVADVYCAKVSGRHYRPPKAPGFAFQELFGREKHHVDSQLATQLLRRLGLYPPGTLVRLANRETACIARRAQGGSPRWAVSVLDARERPLSPPQARDLNVRAHAILGTADRHPGWPEISWMAVWGY